MLKHRPEENPKFVSILCKELVQSDWLNQYKIIKNFIMIKIIKS